jgi:predicted DsbA family dithiol-disulfide isomerase
MRAAIWIVLFFAMMLGLFPAANAAEFNDGQRQEMESIIKDYLLSHPEILQEMSQILEQKQKQAEDEQRKDGLVKNADQIFRDKDLKFVLKEFPIFGEDSEYAAKAAIASGKQGKYWDLHTAMFSHGGKITKESVDEIAAGIGLNMNQLKKDMKDPALTEILERNRALAQSLAINGTPAFIIDDKLVPGYLPKAELATAINEIRAKGGCSLC